MANKPNSLPNDFDTNQIVRQVDDHSKEMLSLSTRIERIEAMLGSHEKIADTLSETAKTAVKMKTMLEETFIHLLQTNEPVKNEITSLVNKSDRDFMMASIKRFGFVIYSVLLVLVTGVVTKLLDKILGA